MVENILNLIIFVISVIFGKSVFVDFRKMCRENVKHPEDSEGETRFPNGKRYNLYNFKTSFYVIIEALTVSLYLSVFVLIIGNFCGLSKIWTPSDILIDKILTIICPFSIVSFVDSFKNKVYKQAISIDDILKMQKDPESIKKYLIQNKRFLMTNEIRELDRHFYQDQTINWVKKNGFIEVNLALRKTQDEKHKD